MSSQTNSYELEWKEYTRICKLESNFKMNNHASITLCDHCAKWVNGEGRVVNASIL